jgi:hypothetical protein
MADRPVKAEATERTVAIVGLIGLAAGTPPEPVTTGRLFSSMGPSLYSGGKPGPHRHAPAPSA